MTRLKVTPFKSVNAPSGIKISLNETKAGQYVSVNMNAAAQIKYFGRSLDPAKDAIDIELHDEPRHVHLMGIRLTTPADEHGLPISSSFKRSVRMRLTPWFPAAKGKRPSVAIPVIKHTPPASVTVKLPEWARPPAAEIGQGKSIMEA